MPAKCTYTSVNGTIISQRRDGVRTGLVPDSVGSTIAAIGSDQTVTDRFGYTPYGEVQRIHGVTPLALTFGGAYGYYTDQPSRVYVRARMLDTGSGRWLSRDPLSMLLMHSSYSYAGNNPTTWSDPSGLFTGQDLVTLCQYVASALGALAGGSVGWTLGVGLGGGAGAIVGCIGGTLVTGPGGAVTCPGGILIGAGAIGVLLGSIGAVLGGIGGFAVSKELCESLTVCRVRPRWMRKLNDECLAWYVACNTACGIIPPGPDRTCCEEYCAINLRRCYPGRSTEKPWQCLVPKPGGVPFYPY